jgi:hypothetical protein
LKQRDAIDLDGRDLGPFGHSRPIGWTAVPPSSERQVRTKRPLVPRDAGLGQTPGYLAVQIDGGVDPGHDSQVEDAGRTPRGKRTQSPESDPEGIDGNVTGHQVDDGRGTCLGDLADEHQREMHLFRPDQPESSPASSEPPLLTRDNLARGFGKLDGGEKTHGDPWNFRFQISDFRFQN